MDTAELQKIVKSGGIEPAKIAELADGLASVRRRHRIAVLLGNVSSATKVANTFDKICLLASKLITLIDPR